VARKGRKDRGLVERKRKDGKSVWYVRIFHEGRERWFGPHVTKTDARVFYESRKKEQRDGRLCPEVYQHGGIELFAHTLGAYQLTSKSKKSQQDERFFIKWWGQRLEYIRLNHITPPLLDQIRHELLGNSLTQIRINRYMDWLRHVLNLAVRDGKIQSNPVLKLKRFKESKGRTRFLASDEEAKLLAALGTHWYRARLAILTGMRREEQFSLRWSDVDLEHGIITLPDTKAGDVQYVYLNDEAKSVLKGLDSWQRSVWVFPSKNPARHIDPDNFMRTYRAAVKRSGIAWVTWHDLRHTYASRLAMNGNSESTIASLLRHSGTALVKRYAHLSPNHLRAAVEGVATFGQTSELALQSQPNQESNRDAFEIEPQSDLRTEQPAPCK
jgi:integrase